MTDYPGIYRARCVSVSVSGDRITAYVPQVFGDTRITITSRTGTLPRPNSNGWVMFESAQASLPVWFSDVPVVSSVETTGTSTEAIQVYEASTTVAVSSPTNAAVECVPAGAAGVWLVTGTVDGIIDIDLGEAKYSAVLTTSLWGYARPGATWGRINYQPMFGWGDTAEIPSVAQDCTNLFPNGVVSYWTLGGPEACEFRASYYNMFNAPLDVNLTLATRAVRVG